ncbi:hypothetical protein [Rhodococcus tibetensis]|uniref:Integral membrane protein n=1 Tax=Rhodococcus tibetensis TaxID=2965064 RepID=A0ABT1Q9X3_9NOCA|nr:hypothetical protein [Rhodococcus sp. FXJ9.536]MCQ4119059.1 hypothetical protein [Rhodococcus sp. FXJ9.536]
MLVVTLVLAAVGFGLLVVALMTGSVIWAWGCIVVCVAGAVLLLVSALAGRRTAAGPGRDTDSVPPSTTSGESANRSHGGEGD